MVALTEAERFFALRTACNTAPKLSICKLLLLGLIGFHACLFLCLQVSQSRQLSSSSSSRLEKKLFLDFSYSSLAQSADYLKKSGKFRAIGNEIDWNRTNPVGRDVNLWDNAKVLPQWMKEYFAWHKAQRARMNEKNWKQFKFIVMQCTLLDRRCGGTADRLKPMPMMILLGHLHRRILMIHWESPKPLEEFLLPPVGGLDWRMPEYLVPEIGFVRPPINSDKGIHQAINDKTDDVNWNFRYQTYHSGAQYFHQYKPPGTPTFDEVYHELWHILFTPSPPVARQIESFFQTHGLVPNQYAAAHVRAQYSVYQERPRAQTLILTQNALNCASRLYPGAPIFLASDDPYATQVALAYGSRKGGTIVARNDSNAPLHLELAKNATARSAKEYYDTFVDLYLMGMSRCVTYNKGGFGHWASLISYNVSCKLRHQFNLNLTWCFWKRPSPLQERTATATTLKNGLLLPPMTY